MLGFDRERTFKYLFNERSLKISRKCLKCLKDCSDQDALSLAHVVPASIIG